VLDAANVTPTFGLWPLVSAVPFDSPLKLTPGTEMLTLGIVTPPLPVFFSVTV
jgi:hypothetical protein